MSDANPGAKSAPAAPPYKTARTFQRRSLGYLAAVFGIAAVTAIFIPLRGHINEMTVALAMLLVVLFIATVWGRWPGLAASVLGMLCLNYFFLPPIYTFTIADPKNWIALAAFFITAITAGQLSERTKRRVAEAEASRQQARLASAYNRSLLEASLDPLMTIGRDGKINDVNAAAETVTGHSRAELIGTEFAEHFTGREKARAAYEQVFRDGSVRGCALQLRHRAGHGTSVLYDGSLYRDADGNVIGVVATTRPIHTYVGEISDVPPDPRVVRHLSLFVRFASLFSLGVGLLSIVGLVFHIAVLKSTIPGKPVIKMNAAICLTFLGFALWSVRKVGEKPDARIMRLSGKVLAGITALVGLLSLTEHLFGRGLGIDELVFREPVPDAFVSLRPGLIAPITALDLLLLGLTLLLLDHSVSRGARRYWPAQYFASVTAILSIVGVLDFLLGSPYSYTRIALQTAVTLLLLSLGLLCARTERGLAALLASSTSGGALTRRLLPAAILVPIAIGALSWNAFSAGRFSAWGAVSLMIITMISLLGAFSIWNGYVVNRGDLERGRAEGILHRREVELSEAQRLAQVGSWWWDPKTDSVIWSGGLSHIAGRDPLLPPPTFKEHLGIYTPESSKRLTASVESSIQTGAPYELDLEIMRADSNIRNVSVRGEVERDAGGKVAVVRGTLQDITDRKQAETEMRLLARLQAVVAELGVRALRHKTLSDVVDDVTAQVAQTLKIEYCKILEFLPDREALILRSGVGWRPGYVGHATVGLGKESQAGFTLASDEPVVVEDLQSDKRFLGTALLQEHGVVSGVTVVISTKEGPYGVLGAHSSCRRTFSTNEVNFLQSVANVLGSAIERHRDEAHLWRINQAQRALSKCNEALVRATDESVLLQQICDIVVEEAGYRFCWVGRAETDEAKSILPLAKAGYEAGYLDTLKITWADTERGQGPTGKCIRTRQTVVARNIATDSRMMPWREEALKRGYSSSASIPLLIDSTVFGAIMIYGSEPEGFGLKEVELLTELASDLAFGIKTLRTRALRFRAEEEILTLNAELEQRVVRRTALLQAANKELEQAREREIEVGFRIQKTLLLDQPPEDVPGLRVAALTVASQWIDGDFYIFIKHQNQSLDVIVGDVMGKGIPAALLGAATKSHFLKALSDLMDVSKGSEIPEPKEIVMLAHAGVVRDLIKLESFVTLCYVRLDAVSRRFQFVDCGHTGILHLHAKTDLCEILHGNNLPMGVREGEIYDQVSVPIEPGDLLFLFSDGITEARNPARELFGVDRLEECVLTNRHLEPAALVKMIREAVFAFAQSDQLTDDLTSVAIRVEEVECLIARAEIDLQSDLTQLRRSREFVRTFCCNLPSPVLDEESVGALELAVNEAASNIMKHAYHGRTDQWIHLEGQAFADRVLIRLHHFGDPFDPSQAQPPSLDGSRESGFGVYLIRQSTEGARYYRDERGRNCVELVRKSKSIA